MQSNKYVNLLTHDLGKATSYFQEYIRDVDISPLKNDEKKRHGLLSGVLTFKIVRKVMEDECLAFLSYMVVSKHHGELDDFKNFISVLSGDEKNINLLMKQFESIDKDKLNEVIKGLELILTYQIIPLISLKKTLNGLFLERSERK